MSLYQVFEPDLFSAVSSLDLRERASLLYMCASGLLALVELMASLGATYELVQDSDSHWSLESMNVKQRYHRQSCAFVHCIKSGKFI